MIPKFRAWDKEHDEMLYPDDVDKIYFEITVDGIVTYDMRNVLPYDDIPPYLDTVIMQSTGLHDVNGKEIFEGDILNHPLQGMRKVYYPFNDRVASYGLENIENGMRSTLQDAHRLYEIIGNVHEHPGLLEENDE